jgi:tripartite-type tricarboxylate transporter receptor subunit TctC
MNPMRSLQVSVRAEEYPTRGSPSALLGRPAERMTQLAKRLGKPIVSENRVGAGSTPGVAAAARTTPAGYTLAAAGSGQGISSRVALPPSIPVKAKPGDPGRTTGHVHAINLIYIKP